MFTRTIVTKLDRWGETFLFLALKVMVSFHKKKPLLHNFYYIQGVKRFLAQLLLLKCVQRDKHLMRPKLQTPLKKPKYVDLLMKFVLQYFNYYWITGAYRLPEMKMFLPKKKKKFHTNKRFLLIFCPIFGKLNFVAFKFPVSPVALVTVPYPVV